MMLTLVSSSGERYELPASRWRVLLFLAATAGGWRPAGTTAPAGWEGPRPWPGYYDPAAGQSVAAADAGALSAGLVAAIRTLHVLDEVKPDAAARILSLAQSATIGLTPFGPGHIGVAYPLGVPPRAVTRDAAGDARVFAWLEELAAFCRRGAFRIG